MLYRKSILLVFFLNSLLIAEVGIPKAGEDLILTDGLAIPEFFAKRAQPSQCRKMVEERLLHSQTLKKELDALLAAHAPAEELDAKEEEFVDFRKTELLDLLEECGPCATQPMGKNGTWKISDGSCYVPSENAEKANKAFDAAVQMLSNSKLFARHRGGFDSVLEFIPINRQTGAFLPHVEKIQSGTAIDTFIAVRGPGASFHYLFENRVELIESPNGVREFIVRFNGLPQPDGFKPKLKDITLAGTERKVSLVLPLNNVIGMWYVRNDGYYRYFTAADFGLASIFTGAAKDKAARKTLIDTVLTLSERGR